MKNFNIKSYIIAAVALLIATSCSEDFLEPTVSTAKPVETSINTADDLKGLITGAYDRMNASTYYGRDFVVIQEVRSDNAFSNANSGRFVTMGQFSYTENNGNASAIWAQTYAVLANANIVINAEIEEENAESAQARGEAYAIRALVYMDLLRMYGQQNVGGDLGVPLILEFSSANPFPKRATVSQVWESIGADLETAVASMDPSITNNIRFSYWAAKALQSRYFLYTGEDEKAAQVAKEVIDSGLFSLADDASYLNSWYGRGGNNVLFQLAFTGSDQLNFNSLYQIYQNTTYGDVVATQDLYDLFENSDIRQQLYTLDGPYIRMTGKYPSIDYTDNIKVIRYAEVVLNYAEALVRTSSPDALTWLNVIPNERGATPYAAATLDNVNLERRKEMAMEGHRFFDLMRNGEDIPYVDPGQTFGPDNIAYGSPILAFPIPINEINANPAIEQNEDY